MTTYSSIMAGLDNLNYRGKANKPIKRENIVSKVTVEMTCGTFTKTFFDPHKRWAIRSVYEYVNSVYNRCVRREGDEVEVIKVTVEETDRDGNTVIIEY